MTLPLCSLLFLKSFTQRMAKKQKRSRKAGAIGGLVFILLFIAAAFIAYSYYQKIYQSVASVDNNNQYLFVEEGWSRSDLVEHLFKEKIIIDTSSFIWVANQKKFLKPKAGKYRLENGMSNNGLVNLFRSGNQEAVQLTFNSIRTFEDLASKVGNQIAADSLELMAAFNSKDIAQQYGFNSTTFLSMFIPNTYELYWHTSAEGFIKRMAQEYKKFWNEERKSKANRLNLSQSEVAILASIVQAEQMSKPDERPKVAGLYINRLRKGIRLQSDPTLIYILGDFSIRRVHNADKKLDSPYNTYIHSGLPPGPINLPERSSLNAVLDYESHKYLYMCAKADFSGYHNFSRTLSQHNIYAAQYRRELNKRKIMR